MLNIIFKNMSLLPQPNIVLCSKFQTGHQFFNIHVQTNLVQDNNFKAGRLKKKVPLKSALSQNTNNTVIGGSRYY
jgi:hypothetical protein